MATKINIKVLGIKWDEGKDLPKSLILSIDSEEFKKMDQI